MLKRAFGVASDFRIDGFLIAFFIFVLYCFEVDLRTKANSDNANHFKNHVRFLHCITLLNKV